MGVMGMIHLPTSSAQFSPPHTGTLNRIPYLDPTELQELQLIHVDATYANVRCKYEHHMRRDGTAMD